MFLKKEIGDIGIKVWFIASRWMVYAERYNLSYLNIALEKSLERLSTDYIDLIQLHSPSMATLKNKIKC